MLGSHKNKHYDSNYDMFKQDPSLADIAYLMKLGGIAPLLADPPQ